MKVAIATDRVANQARLDGARKGGRSVPKEKRGFFVNRSLAAEAGRKGGLKSRRTYEA